MTTEVLTHSSSDETFMHFQFLSLVLYVKLIYFIEIIFNNVLTNIQRWEVHFSLILEKEIRQMFIMSLGDWAMLNVLYTMLNESRLCWKCWGNGGCCRLFAVGSPPWNFETRSRWMLLPEQTNALLQTDWITSLCDIWKWYL